MYFTYFPKTLYSFNLNSGNALNITNIFSRFIIKSEVLTNAYAMYKYQVVDGDTPEIIAYKQYGDPTYHWVICLTNNLFDPLFGLPLPQNALEQKIIKQYGYSSIANAYSEIHHYELEVKKILSETGGSTTESKETSIITLDQYSYTSNTIVMKGLGTANSETKNITFYANNSNSNTAVAATLTITSTYKPVYVYDYENELNEANRQIKILKPQYIPSLVNELSQVLNA